MSCTAAWNQKAFRGRNDDGSETTATWKANQNVNWSQAKDANVRVRFEVQETAGCAKNNFSTIQLQYNRNGAGWNNVTGSSSVVRSSASPNVADGAATTDQLTAGTGAFVGGGGFDEVNGVAGSTAMDVAASGHFEVEYCVQVRSADVASGDTIQLRVTDGGTAFAAYDATPSVTVSSGNVTVTPTTLALATAAFAPTVLTPRLVTPTTLALATATFAPAVRLGTRVVPPTASLALSAFAPTVLTPVVVTPGTVALALAAFAPTVNVPRLITPPPASLSIATFAPTVTAGQGGPVTVTPGPLALSLATYAPTVTASASAPGPVRHGRATGWEQALAAWRKKLEEEEEERERKAEKLRRLFKHKRAEGIARERAAAAAGAAEDETLLVLALLEDDDE